MIGCGGACVSFVSPCHMTVKKALRAIANTTIPRANQSSVMISVVMRNRATSPNTVKEK